MKDELISFETAKLAKEKGFDEQTNTFYDEHGYKDKSFILNKNSNVAKSYTSAPTQSLLQHWLREEKQFYIDIGTGYNPKTKNVGYSIEILIPSKEDVWMEMLYSSDNSAYDTYELALEDALQRSLNSIII